MGHVLKWAEDHGSNDINHCGIGNLSGYLDEDPYVINHLVWAFMSVNLTGKAREIFCNVADFQRLEV